MEEQSVSGSVTALLLIAPFTVGGGTTTDPSTHWKMVATRMLALTGQWLLLLDPRIHMKTRCCCFHAMDAPGRQLKEKHAFNVCFFLYVLYFYLVFSVQSHVFISML